GGGGLGYLALAHNSSQAQRAPSKSTTVSVAKADNNAKLLEDQKRKNDAELKLKQLLKERIAAARDEIDARMNQFEAGKGTIDFLIGASKRLVIAELDATDKKANQLSALKIHLE